MPITVPNQKTVIIHKQKPDKDFLQIKNSHWMEVNKQLGPYALQLYLYLAKNADNYQFALSAQAAENEAGIRRTSFHKYLNLLIAEGYLVKRNGNTYDFYEVPQGGQTKSQSEQGCSSHDFTSSQEEQDCSPDDTKIIQISQKKTVLWLRHKQGVPPAPPNRWKKKKETMNSPLKTGYSNRFFQFLSRNKQNQTTRENTIKSV